MSSLIIKETGRLDRVLRRAKIQGSEWISRAGWDFLFDQALIRDSSGKKLAAGEQVDAGKELQIAFPGPLVGIINSRFSIEPIWKTSELALFSKPPGIAIYPLFPWENDTFANRVAAWLENSGAMTAKEFSLLAIPPLLEGGLVQRLDRDTSGAILVALNHEKKADLRSRLAQHHLQKSYLAIVKGHTEFSNGEIYLYTWSENAQKMAASTTAPKKESQRVKLVVNTLSVSAGHSLVRVSTSFGTRHVVRVALASLGHSLYGDALYGTGVPGVQGHLLHAEAIAGWPGVPPPQSFLDSLTHLGLSYNP